MNRFHEPCDDPACSVPSCMGLGLDALPPRLGEDLGAAPIGGYEVPYDYNEAVEAVAREAAELRDKPPAEEVETLQAEAERLAEAFRAFRRVLRVEIRRSWRRFICWWQF